MSQSTEHHPEKIATRTRILASLAVLGILTAGIVGFTDNAIRANQIQYVDFDKVVTTTTPAYNSLLTEASDAGIKKYRIPIKNAVIEIADGVKYDGWTFGAAKRDHGRAHNVVGSLARASQRGSGLKKTRTMKFGQGALTQYSVSGDRRVYFRETPIPINYSST